MLFRAICCLLIGFVVMLSGCQSSDETALAESRSYEPADEPADDASNNAPVENSDTNQPLEEVSDTPNPISTVSKTETSAEEATEDAEPGEQNAANEPAASEDNEAPDAAPTPENGQEDQQAADEEKEGDEKPKAESPYPRRVKMLDLPKDAEWINTRPLKMEDLKGKYVVFDFWTYCCINCIHILPELKKLERKHPNDVVVIGVHSAKFQTEKDRDNIAEAVLRYEIEHPVLVDSEHAFWNRVGVSSWPTVLVVDPEGYVVYGKPGEIKFEELERVIQFGIGYYRENNLLDETPIRFDLLAYQQEETPLRFPGKILADEPGNRLFITDSNHNRIVITDLAGKVQEIIGNGTIGREDGGFTEATFDHPQGLALFGETLYVSDTENHMIRKVDLKTKKVTTIAGIGSQAANPWPGLDNLALGQLPDRFVGKPKETALNSPWALWVHEDKLYIAMAGPHQIWMMPLDESEIGPFAGNGREDIVDGAHLPAQPYGTSSKGGDKVSSFAQPSGLTSDGEWLYVADSEGSSIRAVPFDTSKKVRTVLGTEDLPVGRLFDFGDIDGPRDKAKLQHCLGVVYKDGKIYAADTYNNKVKVIDAKSGAAKTLAGDGKPGETDNPPRFDEPAGIALAKGVLYVADTNNHLIRTVDVATGKVGTLKIDGLTPPAKSGRSKPDLATVAIQKVDPVSVQAKDGKVAVEIQLAFPIGWKVNDLAPMQVYLEGTGGGPLKNAELGFIELDKPEATITVMAPVNGDGKDELTVYLPYYYCQADGNGLCKAGEVAWKIPLNISGSAGDAKVSLSHTVE